MKYLIIAVLFICSCKEKNIVPTKIIRIDTVFIKSNDDSIIQLNREILLQVKIKEKQVDSLNEKLFIANYKIERVKYYMNICIKNPSQDKFLKGWIKRAVE